MTARREARVELLVTVLADGSVAEVSVADSGGKEFDDAAVASVRQWRFESARRGEQAIDSRIRVPFQFTLPRVEPVPAPALPVADAGSRADQSPAEEAPIDVTVRGERESRTENRSVSDFRIERDVIVAAPRQEGADVLRAAPGVYIGRAEGPAVAHNYMLRGFDADHGQDIEFRVGGLPINMPSHIHGQGYADLGFLIGDTIQELRVTEGVSDPRQGDFAVAGSIDLRLGVEESERGVRLRSGYGPWNTFRQLVLWAPREVPEETFGAVQYMRTDGFGENRAGQSGSGVFQHRFGDGGLTFRAIGVMHAARSDLAGVVRRDDVDSGRVCFTCVYPHPTAQAQNALANRFLAGLFADYAGGDGANGQAGLWLGYDNFRLQENFTGFLQRSLLLERVGGRGDLIEQQNRTLSLGLTGRYRTSPFRPASWAHGTVEVAADGRLDVIDQAQNLLDASVRNQTWDRRVDASIRGEDLGVWGDLDWTFSEYLRVRAGLRADVLSYDIEDRLGNFAPLTRPQESFITGFRRSAFGVASGPRTSAEVKPLEWLSVLAAYGEGYRSPQARLLEDGEVAPFSKVRSAEFGLRLNWGDPLRLSVGGFYTHLSDDVAFDAAEGRLERIG
ncbi:MAG: TonB family protein, partial [Deltaproteobacteria bacterium]|nr:TonB family protein [Deltaproteobacteria bacterium]